MPKPQEENIPNLLLKNIPQQLVMSIDEAFTVGAQRAYTAAQGMAEGHLPHVVGQLRHFHMNEAFHQALASNGAAPTPIKGSSIITGRTGIFTIGRFNAKDALWNGGRRSNTRRQMSLANRAIEPLVQPELFGSYTPAAEGVVFFVACFASSLRIQPESPVSIQVAVPDQHMRRWLFRENTTSFLQRYHQPAAQNDMARPTLRADLKKKLGTDGSN